MVLLLHFPSDCYIKSLERKILKNFQHFNLVVSRIYKLGPVFKN